MEWLPVSNATNAVLTVLIQIFGIALLAALLLYPARNRLTDFVGRNALLIGLIVSFGASLGSLTYSNIIGFAPCLLRWYQRIFLFPQIIILATALLSRRTEATIPLIILSAFGLITGIYNYLIQIFPACRRPVRFSIRRYRAPTGLCSCSATLPFR